MKKKVVAACMTVALAAVAMGGATLAYFTDSDSDVNVMTTGNVDIIQNEYQDDEMQQEWSDEGKKLLPAIEDTYDSANHIDKVVNVVNNGTEAAYVRTIFAFEDDAQGSQTAKLHTLWTDQNGNKKLDEGFVKASDGKVSFDSAVYDVVWLQNADGSWMTIEGDDGVIYTLAVVTYQAPLASKATSANSLNEIWLDTKVDNNGAKDLAGEDGKYKIVALSQGVQAAGFNDADVAFDSAFEMSQSELQKWFDELI